jgi:hypothetical protein
VRATLVERARNARSDVIHSELEGERAQLRSLLRRSACALGGHLRHYLSAVRLSARLTILTQSPSALGAAAELWAPPPHSRTHTNHWAQQFLKCAETTDPRQLVLQPEQTWHMPMAANREELASQVATTLAGGWPSVVRGPSFRCTPRTRHALADSLHTHDLVVG